MARSIVLLTNLFDHETYPALELACLYHERWEEELVFDEQKTHQDPRRPGKPAQLRSQTPEGVEQELYALSLGHFVVRALMLEAANEGQLDVDRLSFTGCLQHPASALAGMRRLHAIRLEQWYRLLLEEMAPGTQRAAPQPGPTRALSNARCRSGSKNAPSIASGHL